METLIAEKYARALYEAAGSTSAAAPLAKELLSLKNALAARGELLRVLDHPSIPTADKLTALAAVMPQKLTPILERFLALLLEKKRARHLPLVADEFQRLLYASEGKAQVRVLTATALTAAQREALAKAVQDRFNVKPEFLEEVRRDLVGGMVLFLGDQRLDATVLGQLERIRQELMS